MFGSVLTEEMILAGEDLTRQLDQINFPVNASLWLYDSESNIYHLIIASPEVRTYGPIWGYDRIRSILFRNPAISHTISLNNISVVEDRDPLIISLRSAIGRRGVSGMRLSANAVNGVFIEDAFIYKL